MPARPFSYHRSIAPMMWILVGVGCVELLVVHGLLALWSWRVAAAASIVSLASLAWLVATIQSFRHLPVLVDADVLVLRVGRFRSLTVARDDVAGLRATWDRAAIRDRSVLNLALIAWPNVVIDLIAPVPMGRRTIRAVAHRLDDPAAFVAALDGVGRADD